jgi:hypothetical protein
VAAAVGLLTLVAPTSAYAGTHSSAKKSGGGTTSGPVGYDLSYPQCRHTFPSGATFGVVGVNDGIVLSANPCLGTGDGPSELGWANATGHPAFYANTGDPGPAVSGHWPEAGAAANGHTCYADSVGSTVGGNSTDCSYVYGYRAAQDSFSRAVSAESQLKAADPTAAAAANPWWLDVETGNSWETLESTYGVSSTSYANDTAALQGEVDALTAEGVTSVGFYSTSYQWDQVTGGTGTEFAQNPVWLAGYSSETSATTACTTGTSFTGGPIALTQFPLNRYDADHAC